MSPDVVTYTPTQIGPQSLNITANLQMCNSQENNYIWTQQSYSQLQPIGVISLGNATNPTTISSTTTVTSNITTNTLILSTTTLAPQQPANPVPITVAPLIISPTGTLPQTQTNTLLYIVVAIVVVLVVVAFYLFYK